MKRLLGAIALGCCLLSAAQAGAQAVFVKVDGGKVWSETCGSGPKTLLLMHDGVLHSAGFDEAFSRLCARYRVIRFDRRGFGRSPAATAPFSSVDDAIAVLQAAGAPRATVIGASEGGGLALQLAGRHPEKVERLVLVGPSVGGLPISDHFKRRTEALVGALRKGGVAQAAAQDPYIVAASHPEARARAASILAANPQNIAHAEPRKPAPPTRSLLPLVKAPTLILVGDADIPDVHAWAGALEALMPDARRVVLPDAGHLIYLESPEAFVEAVAGFVR